MTFAEYYTEGWAQLICTRVQSKSIQIQSKYIQSCFWKSCQITHLEDYPKNPKLPNLLESFCKSKVPLTSFSHKIKISFIWCEFTYSPFEFFSAKKKRNPESGSENFCKKNAELVGVGNSEEKMQNKFLKKKKNSKQI